MGQAYNKKSYKYGTCSFNHLTHQNHNDCSHSQALKLNGTVKLSQSLAVDGRHGGDSELFQLVRRQGPCRHADRGVDADRQTGGQSVFSTIQSTIIECTSAHTTKYMY